MIPGIVASGRFASGAPASPTLVQSAGATATAATSATATATATFSAATAGNLLVVCEMGFASGQTNAATFDVPAGYTSAAVLSPNATTAICRIFYKVAAGGETSVSVTESAVQAAEIQIEVFEFGGASTWALDKTNTNTSASATSISTGSTGTLTSATGIAIAAVSVDAANGGGEAWNSSFTNVNHSTDKLLAGYLITSATTALNPTGSWTTSRVPVAAIATFTAA